MARLLGLKAENFKRLVAVDIGFDPEGNIIIVSGKNGEGKSSFLDAIVAGLAGPKGIKAVSRPIREGEDHAEIFLDMGDFTVERTYRSGKDTVKVMSKEGAKYGSPQKFLDEKLGAISFDPLAFAMNFDGKKQRAILLDLVDLPFDPDELEGRRLAVYDERTEIGREIKALEGQLQGWVRPDGPMASEVSVSAAVEAYAAAQAQHAASDSLWERTREVGLCIEDLESQLASAKDLLEHLHRESESIGELPDLDEAKALVDNVEEHNAQARAANEAGKRFETLDRLLAQREEMTERITAIEKEKADALAATKMPVEGLSFDEEGILYDGIPFSQASSAQQLRVSLAIAMATKPEIRLCRIADGSLLDSESMRLVAEMAEEHNFQVLLEIVDESGELGIVIEGGMVKE